MADVEQSQNAASAQADAANPKVEDAVAERAGGNGEGEGAGGGGARKVVVAVDASEESSYALDWALQHLVQRGDRVHLLHVQAILHVYGAAGGATAGIPGPAGFYIAPEVVDAVKKYEESRSRTLLAAAMEKCRAHNVAAEMDVISGEPREAICAAVEQLQAGLLVMGSHGYGAVQRALLGSVSDHCVHHATCPVVVVRRKA